MPWGDTRTSAQKEQEAKQIVYSLLPKDGTPISWGDLKRKAEQLPRARKHKPMRAPKLSSATLSKHLKKFVETGLVIKKELRDKTSKRLPKMTYRLAKLTEEEKRWLEETRKRGEEWKKRWTEEHDEAVRRLATEFNLFVAHLANVIIDACKESSLDKAHEHVNLMLEVSLVPHVLSLTKSGYSFRSVEFDGYSILSMVMDSFLFKAEEIMRKDKTLIKWLNEQLRLNRFAARSGLMGYDLTRFVRVETQRLSKEK